MKINKRRKPIKIDGALIWIPVAGLYGGQGWSRTTVLGFSDRRANRVRHLPIRLFFFTRHIKKIMLDLNQLHPV